MAAQLVEGNIIIGGFARGGGRVLLPGLITSIKDGMVRIENPHGSFWLDLPLNKGRVVTVRGLLNEFA